MQAIVIRYLSRLHKILALLIGLQLLFWTISGFYFTLFPIETIHGDHLRKDVDHGQLEPSKVKVSVEQVGVIYSGNIQSVTLNMFYGTPVWSVTGNGAPNRIDAITGRPVTVDEVMVRKILKTATTSEAPETMRLQLLKDSAPREYSGPLPAYQATDKSSGARFYIPFATGEIKSVRTNEWRLFDILWRFHIQDITGADRFDSWWLKLFAGSAIAFTLTGLGLLFHRSKVGRLFS